MEATVPAPKDTHRTLPAQSPDTPRTLTSLYNCRTIPHGYRMVKFDQLLNVESTYDMPLFNGHIGCSCFQASRPTCRHRDMIERFITAQAIDTGRFYDYDGQQWLPALTHEYDKS